MNEYSIKKLSFKHREIIGKYDCGNESLNNYLKNEALYDYDSVTYIVSNNNECMLYFSLSCGALYINSSGKYHSVPAVEIKKFATDCNYQHYYTDGLIDSFSKTFLDYLIYNIILNFTNDIYGASRIILYSTPKAVNFYKRSGFINFHDSFLTDDSTYLDGCIPLIFNYE